MADFLLPRRRRLLQGAAAVPFSSALPRSLAARATQAPNSRVRPQDAAWPSDATWSAFGSQLAGTLLRVHSPWPACARTPAAAACEALFRQVKNPYFLADDPAMTQALGWVDAWTSSPSVYAVAARTAGDVAAAVRFAHAHDLRLVVKTSGHSYQGTSCAPDSLLVWTRAMRDVTVHDAFVPSGCTGTAPVRAVSVAGGALWADAYDAVTTRAGGYVQGGGCMTVGVAGLVQSGGFGSFSKRFGLAAASLLEAEVVTADGMIRIANTCTHPDLFWALKGGGGGSLAIVTRLTLRVHDLPQTFGAVNFQVHARSDAAFRRLIALAVDHYGERLMNPAWGEQMRFRRDNTLAVAMVFQGMERGEAQDVWAPFLTAIDRAPQDYAVDFSPLKIVATSARTFWSPTLVKRVLGFISRDDRPHAPRGNVFWPGDQKQAGQVLHGYQSTWLPADLLRPGKRGALCDALFAASRHRGLSLHFNKGLAGAPAEAIAAARDTSMNPAVLDAFALAICAADGPPAYPGVAGHAPDAALARREAQEVARCMGELRKLVPNWGAYVSESDYFERDWQRAFWGSNYERLLSVKRKYDPDGLFFVHHGVDSERWSDDGFTPLNSRP